MDLKKNELVLRDVGIDVRGDKPEVREVDTWSGSGGATEEAVDDGV